MALKDDLKAIKNELNTEEQLIEKFIKSERFFKKYKLYIILALGLLLIYFGGKITYDNLSQASIKRSNELYSALLLESENKANLRELKEKNKNLYSIFLMQKFQNNPNEELLNELKSLAQNTKIEENLRQILLLNLNEKSEFLKDYERVVEIFKLLNENKIDETQSLMSLISTDSPLFLLINNFKHYQGNQK